MKRSRRSLRYEKCCFAESYECNYSNVIRRMNIFRCLFRGRNTADYAWNGVAGFVVSWKLIREQKAEMNQKFLPTKRETACTRTASRSSSSEKLSWMGLENVPISFFKIASWNDFQYVLRARVKPVHEFHKWPKWIFFLKFLLSWCGIKNVRLPFPSINLLSDCKIDLNQTTFHNQMNIN